MSPLPEDGTPIATRTRSKVPMSTLSLNALIGGTASNVKPAARKRVSKSMSMLS